MYVCISKAWKVQLKKKTRNNIQNKSRKCIGIANHHTHMKLSHTRAGKLKQIVYILFQTRILQKKKAKTSLHAALVMHSCVHKYIKIKSIHFKLLTSTIYLQKSTYKTAAIIAARGRGNDKWKVKLITIQIQTEHVKEEFWEMRSSDTTIFQRAKKKRKNL